MPNTKLKLLINLARIDNEVAENEKKFIINIGTANGIPEAEIVSMFQQDHDWSIPQDLTPDQKFEYLFELVQLMKLDEKLYRDEIRFCSKIAARLGYKEEVMFDLMLHVRMAMKENELEELKNLTTRYLNKA